MSESDERKDIAITALVVCEDVRHELFNKFSLIGAFSGDIAVGAFPAQIRLAVYLETEAHVARKYKLEIRILFNKEPMMGLVVDATPTTSGPSALGTPPVVLNFVSEGEIVFEAIVDGVSAFSRSKKIVLGDAPSPLLIKSNASGPPS